MITKGQRYKTIRQIPVIAMTSWTAPFTGGYDRLLNVGEEFTISNDPRDGASAVYCDPVDYKRLHKELIPWTDRIRFWVYAGFYLCIDLDEIERNCEFISGAGSS